MSAGLFHADTVDSTVHASKADCEAFWAATDRRFIIAQRHVFVLLIGSYTAGYQSLESGARHKGGAVVFGSRRASRDPLTERDVRIIVAEQD